MDDHGAEYAGGEEGVGGVGRVRAVAVVTEIASSHVVFMSHPKEVAAVIEAAAVAQGK
jgi:hypothetical protein